MRSVNGLNAVTHANRVFRISKLILALRVKQPMRAIVIRLRHQNLYQAVQVAFIRQAGIDKRLRGGNAVLFEHHHEHLDIHQRACIEKFHVRSMAEWQWQAKTQLPTNSSLSYARAQLGSITEYTKFSLSPSDGERGQGEGEP